MRLLLLIASLVLVLVVRAAFAQDASAADTQGQQLGTPAPEMSALPPKADMFIVEIDVRFVPIGDISQLRQQERSPRGGLSESKAEPLEIDIFCDDTRPLRGDTISIH